MTRRDDINRREDKEELIDYIKEVVGYEPPGIRALLRVLAHPHVIEHTNKYFGPLDSRTMCTKYEAPWNCAREAEANYENIRFGWLGAQNGIGFDSATWCEACMRKVMGT